ncbi:hypothetical protein JCM8547_002489 [Rhodosporidiobolus lusitaniae]
MSNPRHSRPPQPSTFQRGTIDLDPDPRTPSLTQTDHERKRAQAARTAKWVQVPELVATLVVGVGLSVYGIVSQWKEEPTYFRWTFVITLIGWTVLLIPEGFMVAELMGDSLRRPHRVWFVRRNAFIFGGWFLGYLSGSVVLVAVWRTQGKYNDGNSHKKAWTLLIIQAVLAFFILIAFALYIVYFLRIYRLKIQIRATETSRMGSLKRKLTGKHSRSSSHRKSSRKKVDDYGEEEETETGSSDDDLSKTKDEDRLLQAPGEHDYVPKNKQRPPSPASTVTPPPSPLSHSPPPSYTSRARQPYSSSTTPSRATSSSTARTSTSYLPPPSRSSTSRSSLTATPSAYSLGTSSLSHPAPPPGEADIPVDVRVGSNSYETQYGPHGYTAFDPVGASKPWPPFATPGVAPVRTSSMFSGAGRYSPQPQMATRPSSSRSAYSAYPPPPRPTSPAYGRSTSPPPSGYRSYSLPPASPTPYTSSPVYPHSTSPLAPGYRPYSPPPPPPPPPSPPSTFPPYGSPSSSPPPRRSLSNAAPPGSATRFSPPPPPPQHPQQPLYGRRGSVGAGPYSGGGGQGRLHVVN